MKISYQWLKDYLNIDLDPQKMADYLTSTGLEVEGMLSYESVKGGLRGVKVGKVLTCDPHSDADKLKICRVDVGGNDLLTIICGAPNVAIGQAVPVALVGASLYPFGKEEGMTISKAKIRGVMSEGMICAEDELGLGPSHDGIMVLDPKVQPGMEAAEYFHVMSDTVFEIGLTPNRTDAMSHYGVARDLAACLSFREKKKVPLIPPVTAPKERIDNLLPVKVTIENKEGCKRYTGLTLDQVKVGPSPEWLQNRLKAIDIKPHNNVVDITNFVLHELGHPLHAFDYDKITDAHIVVRNMPDNTPFTTLDGIDRKLSANDLMICDPVRPLCIAGVYGGVHSGVTDTTTRVFLESAWFDPVSVRRTARYHALNTDASFRFERGADPGITIFAINRAAKLLCDIAGARISSVITDEGDFAVQPMDVKVFLRYEKLDMLMGFVMKREDLFHILTLLGFTIMHEEPDGAWLQVPTYRYDVTREIDVLEEVIRIFGMDNISVPAKTHISIPPGDHSGYSGYRDLIAGYLTANGFFEAWNNSLTSSHYDHLFRRDQDDTEQVAILNPLSRELDSLRTSLLFGLMETARHNINRRWEDLKLFEFGLEYHKVTGKDSSDPVTEQFQEKPRLALLMSGMHTAESWFEKQEDITYYHLKVYMDDLFRICGCPTDKISLHETRNLFFDSGVDCFYENLWIARYGSLNKEIGKYFAVKRPVFYAELDWQKLTVIKLGTPFRFEPLHKFPDVRRDLSLILDRKISFSQIRKVVMESEPRLIHDVSLFDVYESDQLPLGKVSYAIGVMMRDIGKTLSEREIEAVMDKIVTNLKQLLHIELR